ncbi:MAG: hypothetical protein E7001_00945 [Coriobacteriaceae bacterium]|nr:hypothetical protein [Coriobacteriaceae bacterium]
MMVAMDTTEQDRASAELSAGLARHLEGFAVDGRSFSYRVEEVLKRSAVESTEVVYVPGPGGGAVGPFVLKRIRRDTGVGSAYAALLSAERSGSVYRHLPRVFSADMVAEEIHVLMELLSGETLEELVHRVGPSPELARALVPLICEGVTELHEGFAPPLIHRDLKPSNIMVDAWTSDAIGRSGAAVPRVTIIDLGIARSWHEGAAADTVHLGTRGYAPPEQFGFGQTDVRSDVYALGMLLAFCCTGREPVPGQTADELMDRGVSADLAPVVFKATRFDPAERYASASALAAAVRSAEHGAQARERPAATRPAPAAPEDSRPRSRAAALHRLLRAPIVSRALSVLGIIWNIALVCIAGILVAGSYQSVVNPTDTSWSVGPVSRTLAAILILDLPGAAVLWLLFDKRRLRDRIPQVGRWTWRRCLILAFKTLVACFIGMLVLVIVQLVLKRF